MRSSSTEGCRELNCLSAYFLPHAISIASKVESPFLDAFRSEYGFHYQSPARESLSCGWKTGSCHVTGDALVVGIILLVPRAIAGQVPYLNYGVIMFNGREIYFRGRFK